MFYEKFFAYLAPGHPNLQKTELTEFDLDENNIWLLGEGHCFRDQVLRVCSLDKRRPVIENIQFSGGNLETLKQMVARHGGFTLLPELAIDSIAPEAQSACLRPFQNPVPTREVSLVYAKSLGTPTIPFGALREGIINALIHRKYFIPGAIKVALYDDRLEIFSPGSLPGLITVESLGDGTTFLRNPTLAMLARKYKLVEKLGSGIRLIFETCEESNLRRPLFNEDGDFVKLTFYFEMGLQDALDTSQKISQLGKQLGEIRIKDILERLDISRNTATRKMNKLIESGEFQRKGKGAGTSFIYKGSE